MKRSQLLLFLASLLLVPACDQPQPSSPLPGAAGPSFARSGAPGQEDPLVARLREINQDLAARGLNVAIEGIDFFTIG